MLRMSQAVAGRPGGQGEGVLARSDDVTLVDAGQPLQLDAGRWLVRLIRSLVVRRWAGSFTPTLSIRHPQEPPEPGGPSASQ